MAEDKSKTKATRTVKPVYAIMSVEDNDGNTIAVGKENVMVHAVMKNADDVLEALDAGNLPAGTFYKRIALA
tara:strand:- start:41 stop:256 length:216 start_codon:yes stop_codon:yes gene_type:complete